MICLLRTQYDILNSNSKKSKNSEANRTPATLNLPLNFGVTFRLRPCRIPSLSHRVADEVVMSETATPQRSQKPPRGQKFKNVVLNSSGPLGVESINEMGISSIDYNAGHSEFNPAVSGRVSLTVTSYAGLPHEMVRYICIFCTY